MRQEKEIANALLALIAASGDKEKAIEYLDWAESVTGGNTQKKRARKAIYQPIPKTVEEATELFIEKYLTPVDSFTPAIQKAFIREYITREKQPPILPDFDVIRGHVNTMTRSDFFKTYYWSSVAYYVKKGHDYTCPVCGSTGVKLYAYHTTFANFGDEIHHLDEISCACHDCMNQEEAK